MAVGSDAAFRISARWPVPADEQGPPLPQALSLQASMSHCPVWVLRKGSPVAWPSNRIF